MNPGADVETTGKETTGHARSSSHGPSLFVERLTGIEPAYQAWEACALPLSYSRAASKRHDGYSIASPELGRTGRLHLGNMAYSVIVLISDHDIRQDIDRGRIRLDPFDPDMVQPASVDVRLDRFFRLFDNHKYPHIDPSQDQPELTRLIETAPGEPFILHPGEFVLGSTYEQVTLPDDVAARLEGKSSLGRLGLLTHSTAGFIDPGFSGHVTLELSNMATLPIMLWPGSKVGQLCFFRLTSPADHSYGSGFYHNRYQGQRGPTASRSYQNFHVTDISES